MAREAGLTSPGLVGLIYKSQLAKEKWQQEEKDLSQRLPRHDFKTWDKSQKFHFTSNFKDFIEKDRSETWNSKLKLAKPTYSGI